MLCCFSSPYKHASTAIATPPASPPLIPAETGYVSSGSKALGNSGATASRSTSWRAVRISGTTAVTSIVSSCSTGSTSRNHPTAATTAKIPPRMLTDSLVTSPAISSVNPNASTIGQAVGAGSVTFVTTPACGRLGKFTEPVGIIDRVSSNPAEAKFSFYLLTTYTTVKTTTHTASTKCQYIANTSARSPCSACTLFKTARTIATRIAVSPTVT